MGWEIVAPRDVGNREIVPTDPVDVFWNRIDLEIKARRRGHTQSEPSIEYLQQPALVGPDGQVTSLEIIPEVAKRAAETVASLGIANVQIIEGDGGNGSPDAASYDRAIFTAGPFDLPRHFHEQIREGGLLLVVVKTGGGGDSLFLLRKSGDHFESIESTHS